MAPVFVGPQYGLALCHPSGTLNFEVPSIVLENLCIPGLKHLLGFHEIQYKSC